MGVLLDKEQLYKVRPLSRPYMCSIVRWRYWQAVVRRGCSSVVERMLRMYEVLGSIPSISSEVGLWFATLQLKLGSGSKNGNNLPCQALFRFETP